MSQHLNATALITIKLQTLHKTVITEMVTNSKLIPNKEN